MKVSLLSENLQKKLAFTIHAISTKSQLPILSHILLETRNGNLVLSATDLEIGIETLIPSSIEEEGAITVPAKLLLELLNTLPQEKIQLETKEGALEVVSKRTKTVIQGAPREEFPVLYEEKGKSVLQVPVKEMRDVLGRVVFAASNEATRPALSGIYFKTAQEGIHIVATDGYRLSLELLQVKEIPQIDHLLIPSRLIREVFLMQEEEEITLFLSQGNNQAIFSQKGIVLLGRLIEADFPSYEKILPTDVATKVVFDREEMLKAVKISAIFARETANVIKFSLQKEKILVSAKTPSLGENVVEVEAKTTGEENEIAFNGKYLLDVLSNVSEEELSFEMTGPLNPGVFKSPSRPTFLHLIMPIRI